MATIQTDNDFAQAVSWLVENNNLPAEGERFVNKNTRVVIDEADGSDITPDQSTLESALDAAQAAAAERTQREQLRELTINDARNYFLDQLIAANGDGSALLALYNNARNYEQQNSDLTAIMLSQRTLIEVAQGESVDLTTNKGRATYLRSFMLALALIS